MIKKLLFAALSVMMVLCSSAQWTEQASGFTTASRGIRYLHAVDENVVWATAYDGSTQGAPEIQEFTKTVNGGTLWKAFTIGGYANWGLAMICAIDSSHAWIPAWSPTGGGAILYTSDGGYSWTEQTSAVFDGPSGFPNIVHFWDQNNGMCMGDPNGGYFEIYTTTNGGTNWVRVPQADIPNPISTTEYGTIGYYSVVGNIIWFSTNKGRVYKSVDRGLHWTVSQTPVTNKQMRIQFRDANFGIVQVNEVPYDAYYTNNGGQSWQVLSSMGNFYANDFCYVSGTAASWVSVGADISGGFSGISYSTDDAAIWDGFVGTETQQYLAVAFPSNTVGYAGSFNQDQFTGGMWKYSGTDFLIDSCAGFAASFWAADDTLDLYTTGQVQFNDISSGNISAWLWDFGDGETSSIQNPLHTYDSTGTFNIVLIISNSNCSDTAYLTIVVNNTSAVHSYGDKQIYSVYPNPASDLISIQCVSRVDEAILYDLSGKTVITLKPGDRHIVIDVSDIPDGLYLLSSISAEGVGSAGIVVRH